MTEPTPNEQEFRESLRRLCRVHGVCLVGDVDGEVRLRETHDLREIDYYVERIISERKR